MNDKANKENVVNLQPIFVIPSVDNKYKLNFTFLIGFLIIEILVLFVILYIFFKIEIAFVFGKIKNALQKKKIIRSDATLALFEDINKLFTTNLKCKPAQEHQTKVFYIYTEDNVKLLRLDGKPIRVLKKDMCETLIKGDVDKVNHIADFF
ncbi:putative IMV entry/fusion membrane protein 2 [Diachasmimorpha longicaudata entomopoxvirus]|uniref:Putative IMV entry/fusion membrane protein 2 n=1 Tax=Diachasmimorpha longicaudata entomopoxvirus TaxID=109981 RepID=A0A7R5WK01_9POXV|nr:putative IMV entry/fusion membrane protein 2 [Diachasmimorpha longicaudata entomopoxvirus]AKS26351.1 putative IMV entry/fusion membrane protein 2 [Diachasmimorpha longicaudata entomopoxvirus]